MEKGNTVSTPPVTDQDANRARSRREGSPILIKEVKNNVDDRNGAD
jgi:hypothetical protein